MIKVTIKFTREILIRRNRNEETWIKKTSICENVFDDDADQSIRDFINMKGIKPMRTQVKKYCDWFTCDEIFPESGNIVYSIDSPTAKRHYHGYVKKAIV